MSESTVFSGLQPVFHVFFRKCCDKEYYKKMVVSFLEKFVDATRKDIEDLLIDKISDALSDEQKKNFVTNLLQEMKKEGTIYPVGANRWAKWRLYKTAQKE